MVIIYRLVEIGLFFVINLCDLMILKKKLEENLFLFLFLNEGFLEENSLVIAFF